ncbi:glycoside hydrolase family 140 protein [Armatimonas sp.]|uniref:glycoside hydrolase family 140 protein n=1 Tax=Armatimonas sp. TaxID=1872638 RepID=UPI00286B0661|nr:glycoside hydrolase family 140 protein [Armatimonas sp.]
MQRLRVSNNKRFLVQADGTPFFWLADTAWELFHRCNLAEAELYLRDRAAKGFTVIQAVVLTECDGLHDLGHAGALPLDNDDPTTPNETYFAHVDAIVKLANALGLVIAMLPTWGDKWNKKWGIGPEVFTPENAQVYGRWLGKRYKDADLIWMLGGDRPVETETHRAILDKMAFGLHEGDGGVHLHTFHPPGGQGSVNFWPWETRWVDFHAWQSGHGRNTANYNSIATDYARTPVKPVLDSEPGYEDHPAGFNLDNGYLDDYDCRKSAYWAVFAGACGHTYGCHPIWQMWLPGRHAHSWCRRPWTEALHLPGSGQLQHLKNLLLSRPYLSRIPDQSLIVGESGDTTKHVQATRDADGSYAFVYFPGPTGAELNLERLSSQTLTLWWYNPRTGVAQQDTTIPRTGTHKVTPPAVGPDWVLVLDDAARGFGRPGTIR